MATLIYSYVHNLVHHSEIPPEQNLETLVLMQEHVYKRPHNCWNTEIIALSLVVVSVWFLFTSSFVFPVCL